MGKLYCIIGQSASGKDTILEQVCEKLNIPRLKSHTTRPQGKGEGDTYVFDTKDDFTRYHKANMLLEYSCFTISSGETWFYYTFKDDLTISKQSQIKIVDSIGLAQIRSQLKGKMVVFYIDAPREVRRERYISRNRVNESGGNDNVDSRLDRDEELYKHVKYDYLIDNSGKRPLEEVIDEIVGIIKKIENKE